MSYVSSRTCGYIQKCNAYAICTVNWINGGWMDTIDANAGTAMKKKWNYAAAAAAVAADTDTQSVSDLFGTFWGNITMLSQQYPYRRIAEEAVYDIKIYDENICTKSSGMHLFISKKHPFIKTIDFTNSSGFTLSQTLSDRGPCLKAAETIDSRNPTILLTTLLCILIFVVALYIYIIWLSYLCILSILYVIIDWYINYIHILFWYWVYSSPICFSNQPGLIDILRSIVAIGRKA